jgi:hypothetical protein
MTDPAAAPSAPADPEGVGAPSEAEPAPRRCPRISEDWAATIAGLVLVVLVLAGVIGKGMIP